MALANGTLASLPESEQHLVSVNAASSGGSKRKRSPDEYPRNQSLEDATPDTSTTSRVQRDILLILQPHDTAPSFLQYSLDPANEPSPKKVRLSNHASENRCISDKLANAVYSSLHDLETDAARVSEQIITSIRAKVKDNDIDQNHGRISVEQLKQVQRVRAFEQAIKDLVEHEGRYDEAHHNTKDVKKEEELIPNGHSGESRAIPLTQGTSVLTLFGNAPTPKQLFSSMQNEPTAFRSPFMKRELPVDEMNLPNGLTATKVIPVPAEEKKAGPTFEETFPPAFNLLALHPPKVNRKSNTRETSIRWEFKDSLSRGRKGGYTTQDLSVADWLSYSGVDSNEGATSPIEKRKQRDRALSGSESMHSPLGRASLRDALAKEEEALFRKVYSSFAPTCDNTRALVPDETKNLVWWRKVGNKRFNDTFAIDPVLLDEQAINTPATLPILEDAAPEDEDLSRVIEELDELDEDLLDGNTKVIRDKTKIDQVLLEISELLETLASHQRIRNASLPSSTSASRTPISPAPNLASRIGRPDSPAEDEIATYRALQREIAYLILKLPPYVVAKLNGDQLSELGVSKLIPFETKDMRGTMEEDQVSRLARHTALATAAGIATLTRSGSSSTGQHYSSTNQRAPAIGQAANTRYGQYGTARTPMAQPQYHRPPSNHSYSTPGATDQRATYSQLPQYQRHSYAYDNGQPSSRYYGLPHPSMPGGYAGYNRQYTQSPQQQRPLYASATMASYQSRPGYPPHVPFASPIKPPAGVNLQRPPSATAIASPQQQAEPGRATPTQSVTPQPSQPPASATPQPAPAVQAQGHVNGHA